MPVSRRRARAAAGLVAVAALVVSAGCGSSDSGSESTTAQGASKPTGAPIKIAVVGDLTAGGRPGSPEVAAAARARVAAINAAGGIKGRPVELIECDAKSDPNAARACGRKVVSDGAVAVVGVLTAGDATLFPSLEQAGVAAIGTVPTSPASGTSKVSFCFNPGVAGDFFGAVPSLKAVGAKKVSMIYPANIGAASDLMKASFSQGVKQTGLATGVLAGFNAGDTQFDAQVSKATSSGVDGVFAFSPDASLGTLIQGVLQHDPGIKVTTLTVSLTSDVLKALGPAADGVAAVGLTQPATATDLPGIKQFMTDMDKHAKDSQRDDRAVNSWASVLVFEKVAATLPHITRGSVLKAMSQIKDLETGGIYPPLSASARGTAGIPSLACALNTSVVFTTVKDGKLVALDPGKFYDPFHA
jgi:branched-chain amino acid transport system substrate-binding protein